jgi:hypothetical protein
MPIVNSKPKPRPTHVAEWTMINFLVWSIVIQVAYLAKVFGKRLAMRFAVRVDASIICRL